MLQRPLLVTAFGVFLALAFLATLPEAHASGGESLDMTASGVGYLALAIFVVAYTVVTAEEFIHLRKSKPVLVAAGIIWAIVALSCPADKYHGRGRR